MEHNPVLGAADVRRGVHLPVVGRGQGRRRVDPGHPDVHQHDVGPGAGREVHGLGGLFITLGITVIRRRDA
jgi:hypothetical protein